ncbi:MAG: T9SS type A sorting domain-containing protein [Bacteroidales bacterium]|nr:T9SS type A sorting domain-containing protein [Bacteroidales bacterium]
MKRSLLLIALLFVFGMAQSQYYYNAPPVTPAGNPGNINWDNEDPYKNQAGWSSIQPASHPAWSSSQSIPFTFTFNGSTVTSFKASTTGLVTFTANPSTPAANHNTIPNASVPNNTICVWGLGYSGSSSNDEIIKKVFGTAPNRQLWISWSSYNNQSLGSKCWTYWSVVLEETSNRVYIVDQRNSTKSSCSFGLTLGLQYSSTSATMVNGSPNIHPKAGTSKTPYDNKYYEFIPGTRPQYDIAVDYIQTNKYQTSNTQVEIRGIIKTYGSVTVTSYDINYSIDNGPTQIEHITGANLPVYSDEWYFHDSIWFPTVGTYNLKVWASNINGQTDQNIYNDTMYKTIEVMGVFVPRIGVHETFTSANSNDCKGVHDSLASVFALHPGSYTYINYTMPTDIYTTTDGQARAIMYSVDTVPDMFLNGTVNIDPHYYTENLYNDNLSPAYLNITPTVTMSGNTITVNAAILPFPAWVNPSNPMKIHIAVVEKTTTGNVGTNGETKFYNVLRKMLPNANGTPQASFTPGLYVNISKSYTFAANEVENISNLQAIVFVQNNVTNEIYQSAFISVPNAINQGEQNHDGITNLYPNPANDYSQLEYYTENAVEVGLSVYDANGRLVMEKANIKVGAGKHQTAIDTRNYAQGIYFVKLNINNKLYYSKLIVD